MNRNGKFVAVKNNWSQYWIGYEFDSNKCLYIRRSVNITSETNESTALFNSFRHLMSVAKSKYKLKLIYEKNNYFLVYKILSRL